MPTIWRLRGLWVISEKHILQTDFERKKHAKKIPGKNNILHWKKISLMTYNAGKKFLHRYMSGKKISNSPIPPSPANVEWSCQPFRGWWKKRIWHLSKCHPSAKWLARVHHVVAFKTKVLHFMIDNTPIKDTNGKRKFNGILSFLFVDKRKLFTMKWSFEEINLVSTRWNQPRQRGFWK